MPSGETASAGRPRPSGADPMYASGAVSGSTMLFSYTWPAALRGGTAGRSSAQAASAVIASVAVPRNTMTPGDVQRRGTARRVCIAGGERWASAAAKSAALGKRSAGSLSSAVSTAVSTCDGTARRSAEGWRGSSVISLAITPCAVGAVNGGSPTSISYVTAPNA